MSDETAEPSRTDEAALVAERIAAARLALARLDEYVAAETLLARVRMQLALLVTAMAGVAGYAVASRFDAGLHTGFLVLGILAVCILLAIIMTSWVRARLAASSAIKLRTHLEQALRDAMAAGEPPVAAKAPP